MEIDILGVPDCPNVAVVRARLTEVLRSVGVEATLRERVIKTQAAAEQAGMRGSPTILVDGRDPFEGGGGTGSLSCRLYTEAGQISGAPTVAQLAEAVAG